MYRLLAAAALEIDGRGRRLNGQFRIKHDVARQIHRLLADLADAAEYQVINRGFVEGAALEQGADHMRAKPDRMLLAQPAAPLAQWCSDSVDDDNVAHGFPLPHFAVCNIA